LKQYHEALQHVLDNGEVCSDRTGVGTRSVFGYQMRFDLNEGFPAVTTKKLAWKAVVSELLWFLEGSTDERRLAEITYEKHRVDLVGKSTIWTANADAQGKALGYLNNEFTKELGPVYGAQWRSFNNIAGGDWGVDQISDVVSQILQNPDSRRIIFSAWNPLQLAEMALPPCHVLAQFRVVNGRLSCQMYQRSADMFLGVPFNIASYALLTHMIAKICSLEVAYLVHTIGDAHIYSTHEDVVREQLKRTPLKLPKLKMPNMTSLGVNAIRELRASDFELLDYEPMDSLKAPMAV
jgi:thymidylate synthase